MNVKRFGYKEIYFFQAKEKFKENKNIFVSFYYHDFEKCKLVETPLYLLNKNPDLSSSCTTKAFDKFIKETGNEFGTKAIIKNSPFDVSYNQILMKHVFPHSIMETFYFTDNRTKIPKEYEQQSLIVPDNQLTFNF